MGIVFSSVNLTFFSNPLFTLPSCLQEKILPFGKPESTEFSGLGSPILTGRTSSFLRGPLSQERITEHLHFGSPWTRGPLRATRPTDHFLGTAVTQWEWEGSQRGEKGSSLTCRGVYFQGPAYPRGATLLHGNGWHNTRAVCPWSPGRPPPTTKQRSVL